MNTVAIPTTGKSCSLYWELLHPILGIPLASIGKLPFIGKLLLASNGKFPFSGKLQLEAKGIPFIG